MKCNGREMDDPLTSPIRTVLIQQNRWIERWSHYSITTVCSIAFLRMDEIRFQLNICVVFYLQVKFLFYRSNVQ
uniref:Ig-like domain-containing protein n=1 Tax=Parascaris univalens TaxID=6257 RepID=A0A915BXI4_PARUN